MSDDMFKLLFESAWRSEKVNSARVVACLANRGVPLYFGTNQMKSHPFQKRFCKNEDAIYLHAETDVIKNALKECTLIELSKMDLYVMRTKRIGRGKPFIPGLSLPCIGCMRAITTFNINKVYYTKENDWGWSCL